MLRIASQVTILLLCIDVKPFVSEFFPMLSSSSHHAEPRVVCPIASVLSILLGAAEDVKEAQVSWIFWRKLVFHHQQFEKCANFY